VDVSVDHRLRVSLDEARDAVVFGFRAVFRVAAAGALPLPVFAVFRLEVAGVCRVEAVVFFAVRFFVERAGDGTESVDAPRVSVNRFVASSSWRCSMPMMRPRASAERRKTDSSACRGARRLVAGTVFSCLVIPSSSVWVRYPYC
jgi:hypothetical protein